MASRGLKMLGVLALLPTYYKAADILSVGRISMASARNAARRFLIYLIRCYRQLRPDRAPCCRYSPSCSEYAIQAITVHGAIKGTLLALWRILRCNPFSKGGLDPVPQKGRWRNGPRRNAAVEAASPVGKDVCSM